MPPGTRLLRTRRARCPQATNRSLVALDPGYHVRNVRQPPVVSQIVGEIGKLDLTRDGVAGDLLDIPFVALSRPTSQRDHGIHHVDRKARSDQVLHRELRVLKNIVQHSRRLHSKAIDGQHHAQQMQYVRLAVRRRIPLPAMSAARQLDRDLQRLRIIIQVHGAMIAQTTRVKRDTAGGHASIRDDGTHVAEPSGG